jgi:hypothetical protein
MRRAQEFERLPPSVRQALNFLWERLPAVPCSEVPQHLSGPIMACLKCQWVRLLRIGNTPYWRILAQGLRRLEEDRLWDTKPAKSRTKANAIEALLEDGGQEALKIVNLDKSAEFRMQELFKLDCWKFLGYNSKQWAKLLGTTDAAIRKTTFWRIDIKQARKKYEEET